MAAQDKIQIALPYLRPDKSSATITAFENNLP